MIILLHFVVTVTMYQVGVSTEDTVFTPGFVPYHTAFEFQTTGGGFIF